VQRAVEADTLKIIARDALLGGEIDIHAIFFESIRNYQISLTAEPIELIINSIPSQII